MFWFKLELIMLNVLQPYRCLWKPNKMQNFPKSKHYKVRVALRPYVLDAVELLSVSN